MSVEYCNPIDLEYKYQHYSGNAHREAADPTMVLFKGKYYLFASMSAGFFYSDDLVNWNWHENRNLDMYRYAPDVRQVGDYLYFSASTRNTPSTIWRSRDPLSDDFEKVSEPFPFWDPDLFCDDDGRVYFYWGCGNTEPIWGIELDPKTMLPIGKKVACFDQDKDIKLPFNSVSSTDYLSAIQTQENVEEIEKSEREKYLSKIKDNLIEYIFTSE